MLFDHIKSITQSETPSAMKYTAQRYFFVIFCANYYWSYCGGSRILSWPEECPQISKTDSNVISIIGTHSHKFTKHADMDACINGRRKEKCGGFAALQSDKRTIWTWGPTGSECKKLVSREAVSKIVTTDSAFAVLSESGKVVLAWGNPKHGGQLPMEDLSNVKDLYSNPYAFVALKNNGECVASLFVCCPSTL
jgi:hypothetical protein